MKVTDLMIGDWYHNNITNEDYQVWPSFYEQATNFGRRLDATLEDVNCKPIPFTLEFFERNGFTVIKEYFFSELRPYRSAKLVCKDLRGCDAEIKYEEDDCEFEVFISDRKNTLPQRRVNTQIKYVHELQQWLRMLGIDKQIVL